MLGEGQTDITESNALGHMTDKIHISSNSWGPSDNGRTVEQPGPLTAQVLQKAATQVASYICCDYWWLSLSYTLYRKATD